MAKDTKKGASEPGESYAPHVLEKFIRPGIKWGVVILIGLFVIYKIRTYDDRTGDPRYSLREKPLPPPETFFVGDGFEQDAGHICQGEYINTVTCNFTEDYEIAWANHHTRMQGTKTVSRGTPCTFAEDTHTLWFRTIDGSEWSTNRAGVKFRRQLTITHSSPP